MFKKVIDTDYLKFLLKQNRRLMIVLTLIFFYLLPFVFVSYNPFDSGGVNAAVPVSLFFYIVSTILVPCLLLSFIMDRNKMDTYQSLPIKKEKFFTTHYVEALLVITVPFILAWLVFVGLGSALFPNQVPVASLLYDLLKILLYTPLLIGVSQFAFISSGRLFDGILYSGIVHLSQFLLLGFIHPLFSDRLVGLSRYLNPKINSFFSYMISLFNWVTNNEMAFMTLIWVVLGFVLFFINRHLYANRQVEKIDDSTVYSWFTPLVHSVIFGFMMCFLFVTFLPFTGPSQSILLPFTFGLILYLVLDGITHRGFRNLGQTLLRFVIISIIAGAVVFAPISTGLFGKTTSFPQAQEIDEIYVLYYDYLKEQSMFEYNFDHNRTEENEFLENFKGYKNLGELLNESFPSVNTIYKIDNDDATQQEVINTIKNIVNNFYEQNSPFTYYSYLPIDTPYQQAFNNIQYSILFIKDGRVIDRRVYSLSRDYFKEFGERLY